MRDPFRVRGRKVMGRVRMFGRSEGARHLTTQAPRPLRPLAVGLGREALKPVLDIARAPSDAPSADHNRERDLRALHQAVNARPAAIARHAEHIIDRKKKVRVLCHHDPFQVMGNGSNLNRATHHA